MREELQRLRRENSSLDANTHEQDKTLTQLRTRVAVLEQELQGQGTGKEILKGLQMVTLCPETNMDRAYRVFRSS